MDEIIQQVGTDHKLAARLHLAWLVEQTVLSYGMVDSFTDANGNGPFAQALMKGNANA